MKTQDRAGRNLTASSKETAPFTDSLWFIGFSNVFLIKTDPAVRLATASMVRDRNRRDLLVALKRLEFVT